MTGTDDLSFDPLASDEPLDLTAVRDDDALITALAGAGIHNVDDIRSASDEELIALLSAWVASARPVKQGPVHLLPLGRSVVTGCCRRRLGELPKDDPVTGDPDDVTCPERSW